MKRHIDIITEANQALEESKKLTLNTREKKVKKPPQYPNRINIPKIEREPQPEPTEVAIQIPEDKEIYKRWLKTIDSYLLQIDLSIYPYDLQDNQCYYWNDEECPISIDPHNWELKIYSKKRDKYFYLLPILYNKIISSVAKYFREFNYSVFDTSLKDNQDLNPVRIWNHQEYEGRYYLYDWKATGLKYYFDLWEFHSLDLIWDIIERTIKKLKKMPKNNREGKKVRYYLKPLYSFEGLDKGASFFTDKEIKAIREKLNYFLERYKDNFWTYRDVKENERAYLERKKKIGF